MIAPDLSAVAEAWRSAYEAEKARREAVEAELARVRAEGTGASAQPRLDDEIEAAVVRFSFGDPALMSANRTFARTQLAAGARREAVVDLIRRGGYSSDEE